VADSQASGAHVWAARGTRNRLDALEFPHESHRMKQEIARFAIGGVLGFVVDTARSGRTAG